MATISDIAKIAGVSVATVSHVVNNTRYVSPELRNKVEQAINNADVPPNFVIRKRNIKKINTNSAKIILFLISELQNPFYLDLEEKLKASFESKGYVLMTSDISGEAKIEILEQLLSANVNISGIIISVDIASRTLCTFLKKFDVPKVIIGNDVDGLECDRVMSANFDGAYKATVHLIRSGHENIAILCSDSSFQSNKDRISGFQTALSDNGIALSRKYVMTDLKTYDDVAKALNKLYNTRDIPSAIFVANYKTLIFVLEYMKVYNIKCPEDISIIGFNDYIIEHLLTPPITTISQDIQSLCDNAQQLLMRQIDSKNNNYKYYEIYKPSKIEVPTKLFVRESTYGIGRGPFGEKAASSSEIHLSEKEIELCQNSSFKVAISFHYSGKSWMKLQEQGIRDVLSRLNISIIAITDANFDPELQKKQLKSIMMLEPDALISFPADNQITSATYKEISKTNTKMIFISHIPDGIDKDDYSACVSVNERSHGRAIGRGLGDYMMQVKKTKIGMIKYRADFYTTNQRDMAAEQILTEEYPELEICATETFFSEEEAYDATKRLMSKNKDISGVYVSWEGPAQHVMRALTDIQRQDVAISTGDLEYNTALSMAKGGMIKSVSAQCLFEQGQALALSVANVLIGKTIPSYIGIEPLYVDKNNLRRVWTQIYKQEIPDEIKQYL